MKKFRQYRSNQGRSPEQEEQSLIVFSISIVGLFIVMIIMLLWE